MRPFSLVTSIKCLSCKAIRLSLNNSIPSQGGTYCSLCRPYHSWSTIIPLHLKLESIYNLDTATRVHDFPDTTLSITRFLDNPGGRRQPNKASVLVMLAYPCGPTSTGVSDCYTAFKVFVSLSFGFTMIYIWKTSGLLIQCHHPSAIPASYNSAFLLTLSICFATALSTMVFGLSTMRKMSTNKKITAESRDSRDIIKYRLSNVPYTSYEDSTNVEEGGFRGGSDTRHISS